MYLQCARHIKQFNLKIAHIMKKDDLKFHQNDPRKSSERTPLPFWFVNSKIKLRWQLLGETVPINIDRIPDEVYLGLRFKQSILLRNMPLIVRRQMQEFGTQIKPFASYFKRLKIYF